MLIDEKTSNTLKDCIDYVYCKLRVSHPVLDSDGKFRKVFNGVSVNSWFSPIGITMSPQREQIPYSPVNKSLQEKLKERAKSASAVLGRRHFEAEQQEVRKDEILEGNSVFQTHSTDTARISSKILTGRFCGRSAPKSIDTKQKPLNQRPHTCHGTRPGKIVLQRPTTSQPEKLHFDKLSINAKSLELPKSDIKKDSALGIAKVEAKEMRMLSDFQTEHEMREAFVTRVRSAPSCAKKVLSAVDIGDKTKQTTPLYWRTKSAYHRKQMFLEIGGKRESEEDSLSRGSLWKPLLYSKDGGIRHKAGCPYKCKGCFRACLVSQDYMDKLMSGQIKRHSKKRQSIRPKFYHRKIVEFAIANAQPIKEMIEREKQNHQDNSGESSQSSKHSTSRKTVDV